MACACLPLWFLISVPSELQSARLSKAPNLHSCQEGTFQWEKFTHEGGQEGIWAQSLFPRLLVFDLVFLTQLRICGLKKDFWAPRGMSQLGEAWFRSTDVGFSGTF